MPVQLFLNLFFGVLLATTTPTQPAVAHPKDSPWPVLSTPNILAHGSEDHFWTARSEIVQEISPPAEQTVIYVRNGGQSTWRRLLEIPARILDVGNRGGQLGILLDSGDWIAASDDGSTTGAPLPGQTRMLAIAGDADTFWALGRGSTPSLPAGTALTTKAADAEAIFSPTTAPATSPAVVATTTAPSTEALPPAVSAAGPPRIVLFVLSEGQWIPLGELPPELSLSGAVRLSVSRGIPHVAVLRSPRSIHLIRLDSVRKTWIETGDIETSSDVALFRLLSGAPNQTLWILQASGEQSLYYFSQSLPPRFIRLPKVAPATVMDQAIAFAAGRIHLLSPGEGKNAGKLIDQTLDAETGARSGPATLVPLVPASAYPGGPMQFIVWAALAFAIASSLRWRKVMQGRVFDLQELNLAPLRLRLAAGLIDLIPALTPLLILLRHHDAPLQMIVQIMEFAVGPLYLLHTTAIEAAFGRSLGKMLVGLRVISIDGSAPSLSSLLIRNLLRVIDIGLLFLPLAVILFSRLRQRTGDVAAGTLVVRTPNLIVGEMNGGNSPEMPEAGKSEER